MVEKLLLPGRIGVSRQEGGRRAPGLESIERVARPTDPGVAVPPGAFGQETGRAIAGLGAAGAEFAAAVEVRRKRLQRIDDANYLAEKKDAFGVGVAEINERFTREGNPAEPGAVAAYMAEIGALEKRILGVPPAGVSQEVIAETQIVLGEMATRAEILAIANSGAAAEKLARDNLAKSINGIVSDSARVAEIGAPDLAIQHLEEQLERVEGAAALFDDIFGKDVERDTRTGARRDVILAFTGGLVRAGHFEAAQEILARFAEDLDAGQQESLADDISRKATAAFKADFKTLSADARDALFVLYGDGRDPEGLDELLVSLESAAGDPRADDQSAEAAASLATEVLTALEDRDEIITFAAKSPTVQALEITDAAARQAPTKRAVVLLEAKRAILAGQQKMLEAGEALDLAAAIDIIDEIAPLEPSDPEMIETRIRQRDIAEEHFDRPVSLLRPAEVDAIADAYQRADRAGKLEIVDQIARTIAPEMPEIFEALAPKNPGLAIASQLMLIETPPEAREAANLIIGGGAFRGTLKSEKAVERYVLTKLLPLFPITKEGFVDQGGNAVRQLTEAALNVYIGLSLAAARDDPDVLSQTETDLDTDRADKAIALVTGGVLELNGGAFITPVYGMSESEFEDQWEGFETGNFVDASGGLPVAGRGTAVQDVPIERIVEEARLVSEAPGRFQIWMQSPSGDYFPLRSSETGDRYVLDWGIALEAGAGFRRQTPPVRRASGAKTPVFPETAGEFGQ